MKHNMTWIREWRTSLGWTQRRAARELGMSLKSYQEQERGRYFDSNKPIPMSKRTAMACQYLAAVNRVRVSPPEDCMN